MYPTLSHRDILRVANNSECLSPSSKPRLHRFYSLYQCLSCQPVSTELLYQIYRIRHTTLRLAQAMAGGVRFPVPHATLKTKLTRRLPIVTATVTPPLPDVHKADDLKFRSIDGDVPCLAASILENPTKITITRRSKTH